MRVQLKRTARRVRFLLLEKLVVPAFAPVLRLLVTTWRTEGPDEAALHAMM